MGKLSDVLMSFGFSDRESQKAFLENLFIAGYFKPEAIWKAMNLMQFKGQEKTELWKMDIDRSFDALMKTIGESGAGQDDPSKFNAGHFLDSFMDQAAFFDEQDVENLIVYSAQTAFARNKGKERNELRKLSWSEDESRVTRYLANARRIGVIDERGPDLKKYDETWIQGAARLRTITRMQTAKRLQDSGIDLGQVRLLTGSRELWAEIDQLYGKPVDESIAECKAFMIELAERNGIRTNGFETRIVEGEPRTYLKYAEGETRKLTETMMAKHEYFMVFGREIESEDVVDSKLAEDGTRPTTETNATDVTREKLAKRIQGREFSSPPKILIVSNQPYVDRQVVTNQRAVASEMEKLGISAAIEFEGVGDACAVSVVGINSEFGALVYDRFMQKIERDKLPRKCNPECLAFQKRCKNEELVPPMPDLPSTRPAASLVTQVGAAAAAQSQAQ